MLRNYFKIAIRNLFKNKLYSFINLTCLSIGTSVVILLMLFVSNEWTFDQFHSKPTFRGDYPGHGRKILWRAQPIGQNPNAANRRSMGRFYRYRIDLKSTRKFEHSIRPAHSL